MNISRDATIILTRDVSLRYGKFLKSIVFAHSTIYADSYIVVNICNNLYILGYWCATVSINNFDFVRGTLLSARVKICSISCVARHRTPTIYVRIHNSTCRSSPMILVLAGLPLLSTFKRRMQSRLPFICWAISTAHKKRLVFKIILTYRKK